MYGVAGSVMTRYVEHVSAGIPASEGDKRIIARFYQSAMTEMVIQWIIGGMKEDPEVAIRRIGQLFDGNYVPGDFIGGVWNTVHRAYDKGAHTYSNGAWGAALGILNAGLSIAGGLSAIYTLGSGSIGIEVKDAGVLPLNTGYGFGYKG